MKEKVIEVTSERVERLIIAIEKAGISVDEAAQLFEKHGWDYGLRSLINEMREEAKKLTEPFTGPIEIPEEKLALLQGKLDKLKKLVFWRGRQSNERVHKILESEPCEPIDARDFLGNLDIRNMILTQLIPVRSLEEVRVGQPDRKGATVLTYDGRRYSVELTEEPHPDSKQLILEGNIHDLIKISDQEAQHYENWMRQVTLNSACTDPVEIKMDESGLISLPGVVLNTWLPELPETQYKTAVFESIQGVLYRAYCTEDPEMPMYLERSVGQLGEDGRVEKVYFVSDVRSEFSPKED